MLLLGLFLGAPAFSAGPDPYAILGVKRGATEAELKAAFRAQALRFHPDRNPGSRQAEENFKRASAAWELLQDPAQRQAFDRGRLDPIRDLRWPASWAETPTPFTAPPPPPPPRESARVVMERWQKEWVDQAYAERSQARLAATVAAWRAHPESLSVSAADRLDWFQEKIALSLTEPQRNAFASAPSLGAALEALFDRPSQFPDRDLQLVRDLLPVLEGEPRAALAHLGLAETLSGARFDRQADDVKTALWRLLRRWQVEGIFREDSPEGARAFSYLRRNARGPAASCAMAYSRLAF